MYKMNMARSRSLRHWTHPNTVRLNNCYEDARIHHALVFNETIGLHEGARPEWLSVEAMKPRKRLHWHRSQPVAAMRVPKCPLSALPRRRGPSVNLPPAPVLHRDTWRHMTITYPVLQLQRPRETDSLVGRISLRSIIPSNLGHWQHWTRMYTTYPPHGHDPGGVAV